jgi:hypothetical protein
VRWTVAALCVLVLAGCGSDSSGISAGAVKHLVLKPADLPRGFETFVEGPTSTLDVQGTTRSNLQRFDREAGWVARLRRSAPAWVVVSTVDVFPDAKAAESDLGAYADGFARQHENGLAKRVRSTRVGEGAIAAELLAPGGQKEFAVVWRSRNASASVTAIGPSTLRLADVVALARKQQAKLARG